MFYVRSCVRSCVLVCVRARTWEHECGRGREGHTVFEGKFIGGDAEAYELAICVRRYICVRHRHYTHPCLLQQHVRHLV